MDYIAFLVVSLLVLRPEYCGKNRPMLWLRTPSLRWRHNGRDSVSNHQPHDWLLNRLFRRRSKKTSKLSVTGLCAGNSPGTGVFTAQMASNAENVSIWWRHYADYRQPRYWPCPCPPWGMISATCVIYVERWCKIQIIFYISIRFQYLKV